MIRERYPRGSQCLTVGYAGGGVAMQCARIVDHAGDHQWHNAEEPLFPAGQDAMIREHVATIVGEALQRWADTFQAGEVPTAQAARNAILNIKLEPPKTTCDRVNCGHAARLHSRPGEIFGCLGYRCQCHKYVLPA